MMGYLNLWLWIVGSIMIIGGAMVSSQASFVIGFGLITVAVVRANTKDDRLI